MKKIPREPCIICGNLRKYTRNKSYCSRACSQKHRTELKYIKYKSEILARIQKYTKINESGCWIWQMGLSRSGYGETSIKGKKKRVHRVVHELYTGKVPENLHVCHTCDTTSCVNPEHLYVGTHQRNVDDKLERDRQPRGEEIKLAKLTEKDILKIRQLWKEGYMSQQAIANEFGVNQTTISCIVLRKTWRHI